MTLDLFTPITDEHLWHPNFKRIVTYAGLAEREVLERWARGFLDRDGKFVTEFQTTFNSSFWELYLHALLRGMGCDIDMSHSRPDFVVTAGPLGELSAEAVIASNPANGLPEWVGGPHSQPIRRDVLLDLAALRLAQALLGKHAKWRQSYSSLNHCRGRPFVICVAPFEQPMGYLQGTEAIDRVLFGGPRPVFAVDDEGTVRVLGHAVESAAFKPSGADVPLGMFTDPSFSEVSGVLFSSLATWGKVRALAEPRSPDLEFLAVRWREGRGLEEIVDSGGKHEETLADGAHLFLNPHAARALDPRPWKRHGIGVHYYHPGGTFSNVPDGALIHRMVRQLRFVGDPSEAIPANPAPAGAKPHVRQPPPDGVYFAGPSRVALTDEIELCLHRGWTIYVGRDAVDHDWNSMAKPGAHLSVQAFMDAPVEPWMGSFVTTRERAAARAKKHVDEMVDDDEGDAL